MKKKKQAEEAAPVFRLFCVFGEFEKAELPLGGECVPHGWKNAMKAETHHEGSNDFLFERIEFR